MGRRSDLTFQTKWIAIISILGLLTGFVAFLLYANYQSLEKLQARALEQSRYELTSRGMNLAHFLDSQQKSFKSDISGSNLLSLYFENKALGMSMEYGLGASLKAMEQKLKSQSEKIRLGDKCIYKMLVVYDVHGDILAVSDPSKSNLPDDPSWRRSVFHRPDGFYLYQVPGQKTDGIEYALFFSSSYYYKGEQCAQSLAEISTSLLLSHFLQSGPASLFTGLFVPVDRLIGFDLRSTGPFPPKPGTIVFPDPVFPDWLSTLKASESVLNFECAVGDTQLVLRDVLSAKKVIAGLSPVTLLLAMVLISFILICVVTVIMLTLTNNLVLQARFEESDKRKNEIDSKNQQLKIQIEERKRLEADRLQLETQLARVRKMEAIGMLAGGVAHDLNNILTGIVSYPELLLLQLPEESALREPIETIRKSGQKAADIVQDLLTLARRGVLVNKVINLNDIVLDHLRSPEHLRLLSHHAGVEVITKLESGVKNIMGSSSHLSKTIMNLLSNAAEAMPDGGEITIFTESVYIDKPIGNYEKVNRGEYICLSVADTGSGISEEDCEKIFEPFFTKKVMGRSGTGLGMSVVWGVVKDHNGYIDITTALGEGTRFDLYFPVTEEIETQSVALPLDTYIGHGETLLIVDDLKDQRDIAKNIFIKLGYNAVTAKSGEEALEYLQTHTVDLVVLDMIMDPGIDGLETYKCIAQLYPGQKAIIASGFSRTERIQKAMDLGVSQFIRKPYTLANIAQAVKTALE